MSSKVYSTFFMLCVVGLAMPAFATVSDHVFILDLWHEVAHANPLDINDVVYEFCFEVETDGDVNSIEFETPAGKTFEIPNTPGNWDDVNEIWTEREFDDGAWSWEFSKESDDCNMLDDFGDGLYTVTFFYNDDSNEQTQIDFSDPCTGLAIPQPTQVPVIINPAYRDSVSSPVSSSWQLCNDPNTNNIYLEFYNESLDVEIGTGLPTSYTGWGPQDLNDGYWEVSLFFDNCHQITNADGIEAWLGKSRYSESLFAVGVLWTAYEVWAGNTDYLTEPEWWEYYHNIDQYDYVKLGQSLHGEPVTVEGDYTYYVIASHQPVLVDAIQGSTGGYYESGGHLATGGVENWDNVYGAPDSQYAEVGQLGWGGSFIGFLRVTNPGDWEGVTVITNITCTSPIQGDVNGDCRVDFRDFADMANNWLKCNLDPPEACWE